MKRFQFIQIIFLFLFSLNSWADLKSVAEPLSIWTKRSIRVCWDEVSRPNDFDQTARNIVQRIIQKEYSLIRTGIEFVDWRSCSGLRRNEFDVIIYQSTRNLGGLFRVWGKASIGSRIDQKEKTPYVYLFYDRELKAGYRITPHEHLEMIAVHEFGHLSGLRHEHILPEAQTNENGDCLTDESIDERIKRFGPYDPNSIMSYCWNAHLRNHGTRIILPLKRHIQVSSTYLESIERLMKQYSPYKDESLYQIEQSSFPDYLDLQLKIGLSKGDIHTLKALYP